MVHYKKTNVTAKKGVNFVRSAVEGAGSLFHKIEIENDLGIDAIIELIRNEHPLNRQVAVQIKSGSSYYNTDEEECLIPIGNHREYWLNHPLPVLGIVYVPTLCRAHWIDIKKYLKDHPNGPIIRFQTSEANIFDSNTFSRLFVPTVLHEVPDLALNDAVRLFRSNKPDEMYLGLITLFRRYPNAIETWDELVRTFREKPQEEIPGIIIYFLAHIPWHGDIGYSGESITEETKTYGRDLLATFKKEDIIKLLCFIDEENGISRGVLGQSVEAIISSLSDSIGILTEIIGDNNIDIYLREFGALILAMNIGMSSIPIISQLNVLGSWYAQEIINHLNRYGDINPYA